MTSKQYANRTNETGWTSLGLQVPFRDGIKCGDTIYLTGQVATDALKDPDRYQSPARQAEAAIENLSEVLSHFGASLQDVVKVNSYCTSAAALHACRAMLQRRFPQGVAENNIIVSGLANQAWSVEIEAVAMVSGDRQVISSSSSQRESDPSVGQQCNAVRCGHIAYLSGQLAIAPRTGQVVHRIDPTRQTRAVIGRIREVLASLDMDLSNIVHVRSYHTDLRGLADSVRVLAKYFNNKVAGTAVVVPGLAVDGCAVQIEAVAVADGDRRSTSASLQNELLPNSSFSRAVKVGDTVYFSMQFEPEGIEAETSARRWTLETEEALNQIQERGRELGVGLDDIVKTNVYWVREGDWSEAILARARHFKLGPATTGVTVTSLPAPGASIAIEAIAVS